MLMELSDTILLVAFILRSINKMSSGHHMGNQFIKMVNYAIKR